jgi:lipoprotein-anchoring transpeptidase ErfK/SrfK
VTSNTAAYKTALAAVKEKYPQYGSSEMIKADQYTSNTDYLILLNQTKHMVYVFKGKQGNWSKIKEFPCCVGKPSTPTPTGSYNLKDRGSYFWSGECRCWYWTRITGGVMFHSQIYDGSSSPVRIVDASMGVSCSHGCVRLHLSNAKWIYDNMPRGTKVVSYH